MLNRAHRLVFILLTLYCLGFSAPAFSWGDAGHRVTGYIANQFLNADTRRQLLQLVGTEDLSEVATYLDDDRAELEQSIPGSSQWHYENREVCGRNAGISICPSGRCVTRQIERFERVLKDKHAPTAQRAEAVRVLVHLIGDLHQPLHLADDHDRGGNDVLVWMPREREPRHLHEVWDARFVQLNANRLKPANYAKVLVARFFTRDESRQHDWQHGDVQQWADETFLLGTQAYRTLPDFMCGVRFNHPVILTQSYIATARETVAVQLAKAGVRIAAVLNESLSTN